MTTSQEKDIILNVVYTKYKEHGPSDSDSNSYNPYADYYSVRRETGLDENVFHTSFEELEKAGMLCISAEAPGFTFVKITPKGIHLKEKDGCTAIDEKRKRDLKKEDFGGRQ